MREARILTIVLVALVVFVVLSATTVGGMMGGSMMGPGMMWGYGSQAGVPAISGWGAAMTTGLGWLMMLAFWGALIVGVVLLVRWLAAGATTGDAHDDPLAILQRRYARGEIDREAYQRIRRELLGESESSTTQMRRSS